MIILVIDRMLEASVKAVVNFLYLEVGECTDGHKV